MLFLCGLKMSVIIRQSDSKGGEEFTTESYLLLQKKLLRTCIFNFFLLSIVGLLLRAWPISEIPYVSYKNVLHAHSHFAFGGWVMPALVFLVLRFYPELCHNTNYHQWRNSILVMLFSAYGMLFSFPFGGYGVVSIVFSTLSLIAGFYTGFLVHSMEKPQFFLTSQAFLRTGFVYFFISSLGPFATGPLIAMGKGGTEIYYNVIYFFLHFQYNGFFTFIILGLLYKMIEPRRPFNNGKLVFRLLNIACGPAYFLSILWAKPTVVFNFLGGAAAVLQLIAVMLMLKDIEGAGWKSGRLAWLFRIAIMAFVLKNILQLLSAFPVIAELAYQNRNFIIAYLHLVLVGFVSVFVLGAVLKNSLLLNIRFPRGGFILFIFAFASTELLLVLQAAGWLGFLSSHVYLQLVFGLSLFFPASLLWIYFSVACSRVHSFFNLKI